MVHAITITIANEIAIAVAIANIQILLFSYKTFCHANLDCDKLVCLSLPARYTLIQYLIANLVGDPKGRTPSV